MDNGVDLKLVRGLNVNEMFCRNGYGSVCEHNNTSSIRLNLFSFIVIISHSFTCFRAHTIK